MTKEPKNVGTLRWSLVVEGDHSSAPFPLDPDAFEAWFGPWVEQKVLIIADWREEARRDGVRLRRRPASTPKPRPAGDLVDGSAVYLEPLLPFFVDSRSSVV
jgi:hypothetical protein